MRNIIKFVTLAVGLTMLSGGAYADPNTLLGEAIKSASKLGGSLPTKERLAAYENVFGSLDKIVSEHPSSDQAIKILSGQKVGSFDPSTLRTSYIKVLTEYYDTVCEASPSYSCLGFVSLKTGNDACVSATSFTEISEAHYNLENAARVFIGQKENKSYISLAMDSYRNCLKRSKFKTTRFAEDFFSSKLLKLLLKSQQVSLAKAAIENMETPYFKFLGVLDLSAHNDKPFDKAFWDRLAQYIKKKIKNEDGDAAMANLALLLNAVRRSDIAIDYGLAYDGVQEYRRWGKYAKQCDHFFVRSAFDLLTTLQLELKLLNEDRYKITARMEPALMNAYADHPKEMLRSCIDQEYYNYNLMAIIHGQLVQDDPQIASEFKLRAIKETFSERQQIEFFFSHFGQTEEKLNAYDKKINASVWAKKNNILNRKDAKYFLFTKKVDFKQVCDASSILFKELKGDKDYDLAIKYMIDSPQVDPNTKYKCGDEDLELLLK